MPGKAKVKRTSRPSRERSALGRILGNPATPVLVGLIIVLSVGFWVVGGGSSKSPSDTGAKAAATKRAETGTNTGTGSDAKTDATAETDANTEAKTDGKTEPTTGTDGKTDAKTDPKAGASTDPKAGTGTAPTTSADDAALLAARARIDRSGGAASSMLVTVYYADGLKNGLSMQPVQVKVAQDLGRIRVTAEQILNAPNDLQLVSNTPSGTQVLGTNLKDGVAIVDLSGEVTAVRGSAAVNNMTASFVYSLTSIPNVNAVQLRVNGKPALLDGFEWSKPLTRAEIDARNLYKVEPVITYSGS